MKTETQTNLDKVNESFLIAEEYFRHIPRKPLSEDDTTLVRFSYGVILVGGLLKKFAELTEPSYEDTMIFAKRYGLIILMGQNAFLETGDEEILESTLSLLFDMAEDMKEKIEQLTD